MSVIPDRQVHALHALPEHTKPLSARRHASPVRQQRTPLQSLRRLRQLVSDALPVLPRRLLAQQLLLVPATLASRARTAVRVPTALPVHTNPSRAVLRARHARRTPAHRALHVIQPFNALATPVT